MALQKTIEQPNGAVATYHRVTGLSFDFRNGFTVIEISHYLDASARKDGKQEFGRFGVTISEMPPFDQNVRAWAYDQIKAREEWSDAENV